MDHLNWIAGEVHRIHDWFQGIFYLLITIFLLLGVFIEYFKLPLGGTPSFGPMVGRVLIAVVLLHTYPEVHNLMADIADGLSVKLGDTTGMMHALDKISDKIDRLSWSWVSIRQNIIVAISFTCFLLLYFSIHVAQALYLFTMVILYLFSPILIALYVLPQTSGATGALYRSLIEASMWKPVWCCIATLLWSSGISEMQADGTSVSFVSAVCFSLLAAGSLVLTPKVIHFLAGAGMSKMAGSLSNIGVDGVFNLTPAKMAQAGTNTAGRSVNAGLGIADRITASRPRPNQFINSIPRANVPPMHRPWKMAEQREHPRRMTPDEKTNFQVYGIKPTDLSEAEKNKEKKV